MTLKITGSANENGVINLSFAPSSNDARFWLETNVLKRVAKIQTNSAPVGATVLARDSAGWWYATLSENDAVGDVITMALISDEK